MEEDIRETTKQFLNNLKENNSKPENIYDYNTFIPNRYLIPLYNSVEELINKNKEQEKIIELMAKDIVELTGSCPYDWQNYEREVCENICSYVNQNHEEYKCFIKYYEKKASENDEPR